MKPLIPPNFVNAPAGPTYAGDLSDALFRTYIRIRGLAWQLKYQETPPLTIEELAEICHRKVSSMWGHLSELRKRGLITWNSVGGGRMVFNLQPQSAKSLQSFGVKSLQTFGVANHDDDIVVRHTRDHDQQQPSSSLLQNFGVNPRARPNLDALAQYSVDTGEPLAREVAELPHVTPDLVHAWGRHLEKKPGVRNLPGLLLYKLRSTGQPPRTGERRGGSRPRPGAAQPDGGEGMLADVVVSTDLLRHAGFSLDDARTLAMGVHRPDPVGYVSGMVSYAYEHLDEPLGFVKSRLDQGWDLPEDVRPNDWVRMFMKRRVEALPEFPRPLPNVKDWFEATEKRLEQADKHSADMQELMRAQSGQMQEMMDGQLDRMERLTGKVMDSATQGRANAASAEVYGQSMDAMSRVAASRAAAPPVAGVVSATGSMESVASATSPCAKCGAALRAGSGFCGACGEKQ